jgi:hypothetical protein
MHDAARISSDETKMEWMVRRGMHVGGVLASRDASGSGHVAAWVASSLRRWRNKGAISWVDTLNFQGLESGTRDSHVCVF